LEHKDSLNENPIRLFSRLGLGRLLKSLAHVRSFSEKLADFSGRHPHVCFVRQLSDKTNMQAPGGKTPDVF
jgi:hypothetical protein